MPQIENSVESPIEARLIPEIKSLFSGVTNGEALTWKNSENIGPYKDTFHSPLAQLWFLYKYAGGLSLPKVGKEKSLYTGKTIKTPIPDFYTPFTAEVETTGDTSDIIDLVLADQLAKDTGVSEKIRNKIATANRIMLAGCISVSSAASFINRLQSLGFSGELDIYDLSEAPLKMIDVFNKAGFWKNITISTRQRDLFSTLLGHEKTFNPARSGEGQYDMVYADVIGHYLSDEQLSRLPIFWSALKDEGVIMLRDLAEYGEVDNEYKVLQKTGDDMYQSELEFGMWLKEKLGYEIPVTQIHGMRSNLFSLAVPHGNRQLYLSNYLDFLFTSPGADMQMLYRGLTVSATGDDSRIFPIFVFEKNDERKEDIFIHHPQRTSIAQAV